MAPINLLDAEFPQNFNLQKKAISRKYNKVKHSKMRCAYTNVGSTAQGRRLSNILKVRVI